MTRKLILVAAALALVPIVYLSSRPGGPSILSPEPAIVVWPVLFLSSSVTSPAQRVAIALSTVPLFFTILSFSLTRGKPGIPRRTTILAFVFTTLDILDLAMSWGYGVEYQGRRYTVAMYAMNAVALLILWSLRYSASSRPAFWKNFLFHWLLFAWLGSVAFPWLGELL